MDKNMQEEICQAHMAGQRLAGWLHPSWSEAIAYFNTLDGVRERAPNNARDEICACAVREDWLRVEKVFRVEFIHCPGCGRKLSPVA